MADLAEALTEVVMHYFAAAEQRFSVDDTRDAISLINVLRFYEVLSLVTDLGQLWRKLSSARTCRGEQIHEEVRPGQGMKGTSNLVRQIAKAGRRLPRPDGPIATIPSQA